MKKNHTMKHRKGIHYLIVMLAMPVVVTPAKTNSNTDLTSDFASTVDDQYTWSVSSGGGGGALAQHDDQQGKGPAVLQEPLEWKWRTPENGDDDRSGARQIDRFLQSPWKNKSNKGGKRIVKEGWNGEQVEDQGPGSIEIYRLGKVDEEDLDRLQMLPPWNNPSLLHKKATKSKVPKKFYKKPTKKSTLKIVKFPEGEGREDPPSPPRETNTLGVPELQIGCEGGLEALPMELTKRAARSISPPPSNDGESTVVPVPPPVNPVTIDWDYNEHNYEEMDELLRLKELEKIINKKVRPRGDMRPDDYEEAEWDMKKVPLRGDLVGGRKVRSILNQPVNSKSTWPGRNKNDDLWGFGENDGYISEAGDVADYDEDSVERIEAERRRKEYDRRQREEWERRRREQLERQNNQRNQQGGRRNGNQVNREIDSIRKEYEARLTAEQREMERKLKDYIERNRPIVVESPDDKYRRQLEEFRRLSEINRNNNQPVRPQDRSRGPSPPATYPSPSWPSDAEARRGMEEEEEARRRQQGEYQRRMDERRRQEAERRRGEVVRHNQTSNNPVNDDWWRRRVEEEKRRMELEKRKEAESRGINNPRTSVDTRRQEAENQARNKPVDEAWRRSEDRRIQDEERRRQEAARRRMEEERGRGQSQANNNPDRARQEAERRRQEMERRRRLEEAQRRQEDPRRRAEEEERRRQELTRHRKEEEERRNRLMEQKKSEWGVKVLSEAEKRKLDEARLNSLPVAARIIISPRGLGTTQRPNFGSRGDFGDVDLTPINPSRPGHPVQNFPAPPTRRPPTRPPSPCVWAVVQCCGTQNDPKRLNNCFEYVGCPGANWDSSPCRGSVADAAREEVVKYYASADRA